MEDCLGFKVGVLTEKVENLEIDNTVTIKELEDLQGEVKDLGDQLMDLEDRVAALENAQITSVSIEEGEPQPK